MVTYEVFEWVRGLEEKIRPVLDGSRGAPTPAASGPSCKYFEKNLCGHFPQIMNTARTCRLLLDEECQ